MVKFEDLGNTPLIRDRVYHAIKTEILLGHIKPGETLNILDISNQMNISGAPVREALNMLSKDGLVDLMPYKKAIVATGCLTDYNISVDLRLILEPYAARLSVMLIPKEAVSAMRAQLAQVLANPTDIAAYVESDLALHEMLHIYANSKVLSGVLSTTKYYSMRYRYLVEKNDSAIRPVSDTIVESTREHLDILDAIEQRDPDLVCEMLRKHIQLYRKRNEPRD